MDGDQNKSEQNADKDPKGQHISTDTLKGISPPVN